MYEVPEHDDTEVRASLAMLREVGGREFVSEIVQAFLEEMPSLVSGIGQHLAAGDTETAARLAHKLAGTAGQFGLSSPGVPLEELELTARAGDLPGAHRLLAVSEAALAHFEPILRAHLLPR